MASLAACLEEDFQGVHRSPLFPERLEKSPGLFHGCEFRNGFCQIDKTLVFHTIILLGMRLQPGCAD